MLILSIFTPLLSALFVGIFGRYLGFKGAAIFANSCISLATTILLYFSLKTIAIEHHYYLKAYTWVNAFGFEVKWGVLVDNLSLCMLLIVIGISFFVHIYSVSYMGEDPHATRFICYLSLFTFFMLALVTAPNFIQILVGWEGVGVCSYLLINFWYTRVQANKAAVKAILVNRVGDFSLILGTASVYFLFKTLDFAMVFTLVRANASLILDFFFINIYAINLIAVLLFIGAVGKSAQIGLHTWLPDAMEGPTPVSALIHAATMVTAGVFLIIRCSYIFEYTNNILLFISIIGALTTIFAASSATFQNDIKKVIAYSTCSQLGYMVLSCGLSEYNLGLFHLMNHAFFKALLFLTAGSIIHIFNDEQDMRRMGGLLKLAPTSYMALAIGSLAIIGFPYLSGFYSKDIIFEIAYIKASYFNNFVFWIAIVAALLTTFYSSKILYMVFLNRCGAYKRVASKLKESAKLLLFPLVGLAVISIFFGYLCKDLLIGGGTNFLYAAAFTNIGSQSPFEFEYVMNSIKIMPLLGTCIIFIFFFRCFYKGSYNATLALTLKPLYVLYTFLNRKWYFDELYNTYINLPLCYYGYNTILLCVEKGFVEFIGSKTIKYIANISSVYLSRCNTGLLYDQIMIIFGYSAIISPLLSLLY
jgi:proton-translocating NADH-quinone oxidoreductase chain L